MGNVDLIVCPYDLGRRDWRCGLWPARILQQDAIGRVSANGVDVRLVEIEAQVSYESETELVFEANRKISDSVTQALKVGHFPLVLGGNCCTAVGGVSGMTGSRKGVVWFDAHGDFCTPETTDTGFLDGMGFAMMVGRCWGNVLSTIPGYSAVPEMAVALVGARDLDPWEDHDLAASRITRINVDEVRSKGSKAAFDPFLETLENKVDEIYLHVDLDALDPMEAPANHYNAANGLHADEVLEAIAYIGERFRVNGGGLSSYDPSYDPEGKTAEVAVGILEAMVSAHLAH